VTHEIPDRLDREIAVHQPLDRAVPQRVRPRAGNVDPGRQQVPAGAAGDRRHPDRCHRCHRPEEHEPTAGTCQSATGTTTSWTYDSADRATSTGYTYDTQGDITTTPSADAGGSGSLTASYYANDMLAAQAQEGDTVSWTLDPTLSRYATYTANGVTYTNHYTDGSGNNATWTSGSNGSWTRAVSGPDGMLAAVVTSSGVTLELVDLHGDVMATASPSNTSTGPSATYVYSEFGTPETGSPGIYGWLGGYQISAGALGNDLLMGVRAYSASDGRFDQVDPMAGGSANAYDYAFQNPVVHDDLSGMRCSDPFHVGWNGLRSMSIYIRGCAAVDIAGFIGSIGTFASWLFFAVTPLSWGGAVAAAAAFVALFALVSAWAFWCDFWSNGNVRVTITMRNRHGMMTGVMYPTLGCW
jgi:RHS repeat-associated protein